MDAVKQSGSVIAPGSYYLIQSGLQTAILKPRIHLHVHMISLTNLTFQGTIGVLREVLVS